MHLHEGESATRRAEEKVELDRACECCGRVHSATVVGQGTGHASNPWPSGSAGGDAAFDAKVKAQEDAAALIRLAVCPHCNRRNPSAVRGLAVGLALKLAGAALLTVFAWALVQIGALDARAGGDEPLGSHDIRVAMVAILLLVAAAVVVGSVRTARKRWRGSRERVRFHLRSAP